MQASRPSRTRCTDIMQGVSVRWTDPETESERERERQTERETVRERERDRERDRERNRERERESERTFDKSRAKHAFLRSSKQVLRSGALILLKSPEANLVQNTPHILPRWYSKQTKGPTCLRPANWGRSRLR